MLHIYHGDGKGKTTAAMGLALRMIGTGNKVFIVQFLKGRPSGEIQSLLKMDRVTVLRGRPDTKFTFQMSAAEMDSVRELHNRQLQLAFSAAEQGSADLIVLDEALDAIATGTLEEGMLLELILQNKEKTEIVLTGRNLSAQVLAAADYVTHMKKEKHPYDLGMQARKGIEY